MLFRKLYQQRDKGSSFSVHINSFATALAEYKECFEEPLSGEQMGVITSIFHAGLNLDNAAALAGFTASAFDVETKSPRFITAKFRLG